MSHDWCAQFPFSVERRRRFNINDRIKELGTLLPKTNDPWVRISFLSPLLLLLRFFLVPHHTLASSLAPSLGHRHPVLRSPLILCLCLLHIPHGPLFPVRDPLRRVSPGQVLETRGFHRKSILRPFHPSFLCFSSSLVGSPRLLVPPSFTSTLFPVHPAAQSATLSRFRMSFNSVNEHKCEGRMTPRTRNMRLKNTKFVVYSSMLLRVSTMLDIRVLVS